MGVPKIIWKSREEPWQQYIAHREICFCLKCFLRQQYGAKILPTPHLIISDLFLITEFCFDLNYPITKNQISYNHPWLESFVLKKLIHSNVLFIFLIFQLQNMRWINLCVHLNMIYQKRGWIIRSLFLDFACQHLNEWVT